MNGEGTRRVRILARLAQETDSESWTDRLCEVCADVTDMSGGGIMLIAGDVPNGSLCTTGNVSAIIEQLQYTFGEGPCVYRMACEAMSAMTMAPACWSSTSGPGRSR